MASARVVEASVGVVSGGPSRDCIRPDDDDLPTHDMTPEFKPFTIHIRGTKII